MPAREFWDMPARQLRQELAQETDVALSQRYRVGRRTLAQIRKVWGIPPQRPWASYRAAWRKGERA